MTLSLNAEKREVVGKKNKKLRQEGKIPGVIYGPKINPQIFAVAYLEFTKIFNQAGKSSLINIKINGQETGPALIHEVVYDPRSQNITHIDLYKIAKDQKLTATVKLNFINEAKAVKELGGILSTPFNEINIECLPEDLIKEIDVDLGVLNTFDDIIHVKDLPVPPHVTILADEQQMIANVAQPSKEKEEPTKEEAQPNETIEGGKEETPKDEKK